jgi:flotillin
MDMTLIAIMAVGGVFILLQFCFILSLYKKCPPDQAMIITGAVPGGIQVVCGGGAVVWPLINQMHLISLEMVAIEFNSKEAMKTRDGAFVLIQCAALYKIKAETETVALAAERFLNKSTDEKSAAVQQVLNGQLCAVVATMSLEELNQCMMALAQRVQELAIMDLAKMGLTVESFTIKGIKETKISPNASGTKNTAEANSSAAVGEAQIAR